MSNSRGLTFILFGKFLLSPQGLLRPPHLLIFYFFAIVESVTMRKIATGSKKVLRKASRKIRISTTSECKCNKEE